MRRRVGDEMARGSVEGWTCHDKRNLSNPIFSIQPLPRLLYLDLNHALILAATIVITKKYLVEKRLMTSVLVLYLDLNHALILAA